MVVSILKSVSSSWRFNIYFIALNFLVLKSMILPVFNNYTKNYKRMSSFSKERLSNEHNLYKKTLGRPHSPPRVPKILL
jgi:hypothetical protein